MKTDAKIDNTIKSPKKRQDLCGITQNEVNEEQMKTKSNRNSNWSPVHHTPSLRQKKKTTTQNKLNLTKSSN